MENVDAVARAAVQEVRSSAGFTSVRIVYRGYMSNGAKDDDQINMIFDVKDPESSLAQCGIGLERKAFTRPTTPASISYVARWLWYILNDHRNDTARRLNTEKVRLTR